MAQVCAQLYRRVAPEQTREGLADSTGRRRVTEHHAQARRVWIDLREDDFAIRVHVAAHGTPSDAVIRLEDDGLRLPLDVHAERRIGPPARVASACAAHIFQMAHPMRKALKVAKQIEHALKRRFDLNHLFDSAHDSSIAECGFRIAD